jgi:Serine/threonine protein kinase
MISVCNHGTSIQRGSTKQNNRKKEKGESFSVNEVLNITYQITLGLQDLHNKNIIHRDIKPANIFITNKDVIKIGDFNVGKNNPIAMKNTRIGTPLNMSPEVFYGKPYDFKADIWSLGCVVYEMTTLQKPFDADNEAVLFSKLENNKIKKLKIPRSKALEILINKLMS